MVLNDEERRRRNRLASQRWRARQTPAERAATLSRNRKRQRQRRAESVAATSSIATTSASTTVEPGQHRLASQRSRVQETSIGRVGRHHLDRDHHTEAASPLTVPEPCHSAWADDEMRRLHPVPAETKHDVLQRLRLALGADGLDKVVCAVCDRITLRRSIHLIDIADEDHIHEMRSLLASSNEDLPVELVAEYDCSAMFSCLHDMLLSKGGIHRAGYLQVCDECNGSLTKMSIPKFSIKNGFYVGTLPTHFADMTLPERFMTQTVSIVAVTRVMRGGTHRAIRSHCLAFDSTPGPPATLLPIPVANITCYRVVLAGPFTAEQQACIRQMHRVRRQIVDGVLGFYQQHNVFIEHVGIDISGVADDVIADNFIVEDADANVEAMEIDADHDRVGNVSESDVAARETDFVERRVVFILDDREVSAQDAFVAAERPTPTASQPQFLVRHSSQFAHRDGTLFARLFPHLFPYGRGHPGEHHHVPVSMEACIRYYSMLSSKRFAEDELFMLASFDYLSVQKMYTHVALKCRRDPAVFERYSDITEEALMQALTEKEMQRQGRTRHSRRHGSSTTDFLRTVELSGGAMWGSDGERAQCRRRAFAYQARFGQPALFVTLAPNVADSFVMAQYCGITSVDTLFDAGLAEPPGRSALHSASMRNDVASARLFVRNIDAFIEHVLGIPVNRMKTKPFDGLFGDVKAYFGMVETQGGGTLHAHFLVWLADVPPNTAVFDRALAVHGDQYIRDIEAFTDSVVTTSMPLCVAESSCILCGHSYADLQELPIPPEAYEDPKKIYRNDDRLCGEPTLVKCSGCGTALSSQHVIRRLLLDHRPASWPPPMRPYSSNELAAAVRMETPCRGSAAAAKSAVYHRDLHFFEVQKDAGDNGTNAETDTYGTFLRGLNRAPSRRERRVDDAFQSDPVGRALVLLPPSVDDERLAPYALAFAVSLLVFMLNLHWWSHVGSCFKKSRAALTGRCRYGYPRPRVEKTCCSTDGVTLARRAPFEYVNGFNTEMMLAFKSNHDIQVMIGGLNALMRIYYATKYVTKMQEHVDSITAVALAAFQRRRLQEARNEDTTAVERTAIGRKRVSSLVYAITNRREIAGPLAALYVLRGSCAFMSTPCATLPLRDVLDELVDQSAHMCDLLELREHASNITFRAASILDDYIFRPDTLDHFSLYEYVAKYFRRKRTQSSSEHVLFLPDHPLFDTHCVGTHVNGVVPVVVGLRMPYVDDDSPHELVVKRSQCALVLFKSFRSVSDLVTDPTNGACWIETLLQWKPTRSRFICEVMANMDDYHRAAKQAKECAEACVDNVNGRAHSDAESDNDDVIGTEGDVNAALDRTDEFASANSAIDTFDHFFDHDSIDGDIAMDENTDESILPVFPSSRQNGNYSHLLNMVANSTAGTAANLCGHNSIPNFSIDELQRFVKDTSKDETEPQRSEQYLNERPTEVIELLKNALESGHEWSPPTQPSSSPRMIQSYSSIDEVSRAFSLNQRQHAAFALITTALLRRFLRQEINGLQTQDNSDYRSSNFEDRFHDDQLLMFLGGAGGTGKSRVIDAVDAFCANWHRIDTIVKTALTGKAATLIGGRTLASLMMRLKHAIREKHFEPLDLLVIDEISMMNKTEWLQLDKLLRCYKRMPNVPFGGVHIVLAGDFLQMPPVKADPIYLDPAVKRKPTTADVEGFDLWRKFTTVVVLEESVRFRSGAKAAASHGSVIGRQHSSSSSIVE